MSDSQPTQSNLETAPQLAKRLQITRRHLDHLVKQKVIPVVRLGRSVRFDAVDVLAALKSQK